MLHAVAILLLAGCGQTPEPPPVQDGSIALRVADWVPPLGHAGWWGPAAAGTTAADAVQQKAIDQVVTVAPGHYDIFWVQDYNHANDPMRIASNVVVESGQKKTVDIANGLRLEKAHWVPDFGHNGWWGAVPVGMALDQRQDWAQKETTLLVPPGRYDIYWVQDYNHQADPMRLGDNVLVQAGQVTQVNANSGLRLEKAHWVPDFGHNGWWGAVPAGMTLDHRQDWAQKETTLLVPPGRYDIYWVQDYNHQNDPMRLGDNVLVEDGQITTQSATSGIQINVPDEVPKLGHNGWWGAVPAGKSTDDLIDWVGDRAAPLLLPPGTYDIYWRQDYNAKPQLILEAVEVQPDQLSQLSPQFSGPLDGPD
jgi:hypothetical protein